MLLLLFGAIARSGDANLVLGVLLAAAAAIAGDSVGYWLGLNPLFGKESQPCVQTSERRS